MWRRLLLSAGLAGMLSSVLGSGPLTAQDAEEASLHSEIELISEVVSVQPGAPFTVAIRITLDPSWHTYWINPGDSGLPLFVDWDLPDGFEVGSFEWPVPHRIPYPPLLSYAYEDEVVVLAEVAPPADLVVGTPVELRGTAQYQVCSDVCIPTQGELALTLPVRASSPTADPASSSLFARARQLVPMPAGEGWTVRAWSVEGGYLVEVSPAEGTALPAPYFFADEQFVVAVAQPQRVVREGEVTRLFVPGDEFAEEPASRLGGVLVADAEAPEPAAWTIEASVGPAPDDLAEEVAGLLASADLQETGGVPESATGFGAAASSDLMDQGGLSAFGVGVLQGSSGATGIFLALLFAFIGGVVLNLMPCVFPVLSVKVLGFVGHGGEEEGAARARRHGLVFGAGVVFFFWILAGALIALRAAGESLGWGFQLQSPTIVALLALLLFAVGLNLSGVFEFGIGLTRLGGVGTGHGYRNSFLTGGLVVLVATPCTAPFMGAAVGYALIQPALVGLAIFTALALGLAAPYMVLSAAPGLIRRLPRPGQWMVTLKEALAFPMYATVVWLVWVFGRQTGMDAAALLLLGLTVFAAGLWLFGRSGGTSPSRVQRVAGGALLVGALAIAVQGAEMVRVPGGEVSVGEGWEPFSPQRVLELRAEGRPVFVDFTAAWCLSCQVNERVALRSASVREAFTKANVALLKADWTSNDPMITRALESFGRSGVPLYVLYPGTVEGQPEILPTFLTPDIVVEAVERVAGVKVATGR